MRLLNCTLLLSFSCGLCLSASAHSLDDRAGTKKMITLPLKRHLRRSSSVACPAKTKRASNLTPSDEGDGAGQLGLSIMANDGSYAAEVMIGTPPRPFQITLDTGSSDFWVHSETCQRIPPQSGNAAKDITKISSLGPCENHLFLGENSSISFADTGDTFNVNYGQGNVFGHVIRDNIVFAGYSLSNHTFGVNTVVSKNFLEGLNAPVDGLMGLGISSRGSRQKTLTPLESLKKQGSIDQAIVSFKLGRLADGDNDGVVTIGGLDESLFDANTKVTFPNADKINGHWHASMDNITVNGVDLNINNQLGILDTGTTLLQVGPDFVDTIHNQISGAQKINNAWSVPCNTTDRVTLTFQGQEFDIDPRDLAKGSGKGLCPSGIGGGTADGGEWVFGVTFLKNVYMSLNADNEEITLAKLI